MANAAPPTFFYLFHDFDSGRLKKVHRVAQRCLCCRTVLLSLVPVGRSYGVSQQQQCNWD